jgi:hypothetical protein
LLSILSHFLPPDIGVHVILKLFQEYEIFQVTWKHPR